MNLTPVESSHIAAIGYLEAERVLLVRYKDGSLYAQSQFSAQEYAALDQATSKGKWLYARDRKGANLILIAKGVMSSERTNAGPVPAVEPGGNAAPSLGPLNVIDEYADKCCRKAMNGMHDAMREGPFHCPDCGTEFRAERVGGEGKVRYWRIVPGFAIHRKS